MTYILVILALILAVKQLFQGGLFVNFAKEIGGKRKANAYSVKDIINLGGVLVASLFLIGVDVYLVCVGLFISALFYPTIAFIVWIISRATIFKSSIDNLGKFTFGSVLEDVLRICYWAYFLYILVEVAY